MWEFYCWKYAYYLCSAVSWFKKGFCISHVYWSEIIVWWKKYQIVCLLCTFQHTTHVLLETMMTFDWWHENFLHFIFIYFAFDMSKVKPFLISLLHNLVMPIDIYFIQEHIIIFMALNVNLSETSLSCAKHQTICKH